MRCASCGTEIADKALICYRCGTATTAPRIAPPPPARERGPLPLIVALLVIVAVSVFGVPLLPPDQTRTAAWGAAAFVAALAVWRLRPVSRARTRRR
jgi:hypothetical protein